MNKRNSEQSDIDIVLTQITGDAPAVYQAMNSPGSGYLGSPYNGKYFVLPGSGIGSNQIHDACWHIQPLKTYKVCHHT